jgi:hypothetical protein
MLFSIPALPPPPPTTASIATFASCFRFPPSPSLSQICGWDAVRTRVSCDPRAGYLALYLRQTANELTGEFTTIMVRPLASAGGVGAPQLGWHRALSADFSRRLVNLFSFAFRWVGGGGWVVS